MKKSPITWSAKNSGGTLVLIGSQDGVEFQENLRGVKGQTSDILKVVRGETIKNIQLTQAVKAAKSKIEKEFRDQRVSTSKLQLPQKISRGEKKSHVTQSTDDSERPFEIDIPQTRLDEMLIKLQERAETASKWISATIGLYPQKLSLTPDAVQGLQRNHLLFRHRKKGFDLRGAETSLNERIGHRFRILVHDSKAFALSLMQFVFDELRNGEIVSIDMMEGDILFVLSEGGIARLNGLNPDGMGQLCERLYYVNGGEKGKRIAFERIKTSRPISGICLQPGKEPGVSGHIFPFFDLASRVEDGSDDELDSDSVDEDIELSMLEEAERRLREHDLPEETWMDTTRDAGLLPNNDTDHRLLRIENTDYAQVPTGGRWHMCPLLALMPNDGNRQVFRNQVRQLLEMIHRAGRDVLIEPTAEREVAEYLTATIPDIGPIRYEFIWVLLNPNLEQVDAGDEGRWWWENAARVFGLRVTFYQQQDEQWIHVYTVGEAGEQRSITERQGHYCRMVPVTTVATVRGFPMYREQY